MVLSRTLEPRQQNVGEWNNQHSIQALTIDAHKAPFAFKDPPHDAAHLPCMFSSPPLYTSTPGVTPSFLLWLISFRRSDCFLPTRNNYINFKCQLGDIRRRGRIWMTQSCPLSSAQNLDIYQKHRKLRPSLTLTTIPCDIRVDSATFLVNRATEVNFLI